jgi:hypothetical protein
VQLKQASDRLALPRDQRRARGVFVRHGLRGNGLRARHQALGDPLEFEEGGGAIAGAIVDGRDQMRHFIRRRNDLPDLE